MKKIFLLLIYANLHPFSLTENMLNTNKYNNRTFIKTIKYEDFIKIVKKDSSLIFKKFSHGQTLLHLIVQEKRYKLLKYLSKKDLSVSIQDSNGNTPLHLALYNKDYEAIKLLMDYSDFTKSFDKKNYQHLTPLEMAKSAPCYIKEIFFVNTECTETYNIPRSKFIQKREEYLKNRSDKKRFKIFNYGNNKVYIGE